MLKERRAASGRAKREPLDDLLEVVGLPQAGLRFCSTDKSPDANALAIAAPPSHATAFAYPVAPLVWKSGTRHVLTGGLMNHSSGLRKPLEKSQDLSDQLTASRPSLLRRLDEANTF